MKISVLTPSIRKHSLELVKESLALQDFRDFEWIVCSPFRYLEGNINIWDRPKKEGTFYSFNRALNELFTISKGELIVICLDSQYLKPNALSKLWQHYLDDPKKCVAGIGNHFKEVINGEGIEETYHDVRNRYKNFQETNEVDYDTCLCSIPRKAIFEAGGLDEQFDTVVCFGDREMMVRIRNLGYSLWIDPTINFLGKKHEKPYDPDNRWDEMFQKGEQLYNYVRSQDRSKVNFL